MNNFRAVSKYNKMNLTFEFPQVSSYLKEQSI